MAIQTKEKTKQVKITTPEFRVSFPAVFEAKAAAPGAEPKFSVQMLFDKKTDLKAMQQLVYSALVEKWGADKAKWPKGLKNPFRDGSEKDWDGYGPEVIFVTATTKNKPGLVDASLNPIIERGEFYGGCYARATVTAFAYDKAGNKGVSFGLRNIQKLRDGKPFSGNSKPEEDFDAIPVPAGGASEGAEGMSTSEFLGELG